MKDTELTISQRVKKFIEHERISIREFERRCSLSNGYINAISKVIMPDKLSSIILQFPHLNKYWVMTGEGNMLNNDADKAAKPEMMLSDVRKGSPLIPIEAIAGYGMGNNNGITYEDCDYYVVPDFDKRGMDYLIRVSGSSMYPKYSNGDILACKKIHEITFFQWGKVYVIDSVQGALVKRIFEDPKNEDNVVCVSDNKEHYPPFVLPKSEIRSLSIVLGVVRTE